MGACTVAIDDSGYSPMDCSVGYAVRCKVTLSGNYATGGDSITPALFGLGNLVKLWIEPAQGYVTEPRVSNLTIRMWWSGTAGAILGEVTAGTVLSAVTVDCVAYGY